MHAKTCRNCFKACLCIGRIHIREHRFMDASSKAKEVNAPSSSACFLNSISCHPFSCLKNAHVPPVRNLSTQERALLSLLSLSRAGTTHSTDRMAAPLQHEDGCMGLCCASPKCLGKPRPDQMELSDATKGSNNLSSAYWALRDYLQIPCICWNHPLTP